MHILVLFTDALAASDVLDVFAIHDHRSGQRVQLKRHSAGCSQGNALLSGTCAA
jgi:hypothetical protein